MSALTRWVPTRSLYGIVPLVCGDCMVGHPWPGKLSCARPASAAPLHNKLTTVELDRPGPSTWMPSTDGFSTQAGWHRAGPSRPGFARLQLPPELPLGGDHGGLARVVARNALHR